MRLRTTPRAFIGPVQEAEGQILLAVLTSAIGGLPTTDGGMAQVLLTRRSEPLPGDATELRAYERRLEDGLSVLVGAELDQVLAQVTPDEVAAVMRALEPGRDAHVIGELGLIEHDPEMGHRSDLDVMVEAVTPL